MLEQISELVKQYGQDAVVNNPDIPNEENNAVMAEATKTITCGYAKHAGRRRLAGYHYLCSQEVEESGNVKSNGIAGLLKNPMVMMMVGHLISKLTGKFNMNPAQASQVSNNLIPNVLKDLVTKTTSNDPSNDSI